MFYYIVRENLKTVRLDVYRLEPRVLTIPQDQGRYLIVGTEHHCDKRLRLQTDALLFAYARGESNTPPQCLSTSTWQIMLVFRRAKGTRGKRQFLLMSYVIENAAVFSLAENDEYVYLDGEFADEHEAEQHRTRIVHEAVTHYLSFEGRSLDDFMPQHRSEFAHLAKRSA